MTWIIEDYQKRYFRQNKNDRNRNNRRSVNNINTSSTQPDRVDSHVEEYGLRPRVV